MTRNKKYTNEVMDMIVGGLDVGTTGCKIALYNEKAVLIDSFYYEYQTVH